MVHLFQKYAVFSAPTERLFYSKYTVVLNSSNEGLGSSVLTKKATGKHSIQTAAENATATWQTQQTQHSCCIYRYSSASRFRNPG